MAPKLVILIGPAVVLVAALGCGRGDAARTNIYATPEVPPPTAATSTPNAYGGGPIADAAPPPSLTVDAYAPLAEPAAIERKDADVAGPPGGTYGASSDDRSPGAAYDHQPNAGIEAPNTVNGGK